MALLMWVVAWIARWDATVATWDATTATWNAMA